MKQRHPASHYVVLYGLTLITVYALAVALVFALDAAFKWARDRGLILTFPSMVIRRKP